MTLVCWLLRNMDFAVFACRDGHGCGNVDASDLYELASVIRSGMSKRKEIATLILCAAGEWLKKNEETKRKFIKEISKL